MTPAKNTEQYQSGLFFAVTFLCCFHIVDKCSKRCQNDQRISGKAVFIRHFSKQEKSQQRCKDNL